MGRVGHLKTNKWSNIGIHVCASNTGSINFSDQCLHIISLKPQMNGIKMYNKINKSNPNQSMTHNFTI